MMRYQIHSAASLALLLLLPALGLTEADPVFAQAVAEQRITFTADFEGANLGDWRKVDERTFEITIRPDNAAGDSRWYSFRLRNAADGSPVTIRITNAGRTNASGAWRFNRPVVSHDGGKTWRRIENTAYNDGVFRFTYRPRSDSDWLALVPVYNLSRWTDLLDRIESHPRVAGIEVIADSLDGNPVHLLTIANSDVPQSEKESVWIVGRQHPAETPSSWMIEGLIEWLLSDAPRAHALLKNCSFHIIGFLNPDGVLRGNYRTNAAGLNLNRQWRDPDPKAPTIHAAIEVMKKHDDAHDNVLFFADMHAHSSIRQNFFFHHTGDATSPRMYERLRGFMRAFNDLNPDFYAGPGRAGDVEGTTAKAWGYRALGAHSVTFEASYQSVKYGPNAGQYMSVDRYKALGEDFGRAIAQYFYPQTGWSYGARRERGARKDSGASRP